MSTEHSEQPQLPTPQPSAPVPAAPPADPLANLTLPQRRYLAAIQGGATQRQALLRAGGTGSEGVSPGTVQTWLYSSPQFARAHDTIQAGLAVMGIEHARALAAAEMPDIVGHWADKAKHAQHDRDQIGFGRLLGEGAGLLGVNAEKPTDGRSVALAILAELRAQFQAPAPEQARGPDVVEGQAKELPKAE